MQEHSLLEKVVRKFAPFIPFFESLFLCVSLTIFVVVKESLVYIYILYIRMEIHPQKVQGMSKQMSTHERKTETIKIVVMKWKT